MTKSDPIVFPWGLNWKSVLCPRYSRHELAREKTRRSDYQSVTPRFTLSDKNDRAYLIRASSSSITRTKFFCGCAPTSIVTLKECRCGFSAVRISNLLSLVPWKDLPTHRR
jgi:hypothetical protein